MLAPGAPVRTKEVMPNMKPPSLSLPSPAQHPAWLRAKRRQLTRLLGGFPPRPPLHPQTIRRKTEADRIIEWISYEAEPGDLIPAVLLIPRHRTPPIPAVLCHHQHAGEYHLGKSEVLGLAGSSQQAYAAELCARGYVTLSPDAICFEDRAHPTLSGPEYERFLAHELLLKGLTLQGKLIWDIVRGLDYLRSREEVDPERIGMIGHSLGGIETWFAAALEPRIKVAAVSCGISTYAAVLAAGVNHSYGFYVPGMLKWGDIPEIVSLIAPRPFLMLAGEEDSIFPLEGARDVLSRARMLYRRLRAAEAIELFVSPGGHEFSDEMRQRAYHWFDRWL